MKRCKDCKWCDPYTERDIIEYDTAYGWCEKKKKDVGIIGEYKCGLWRTKSQVAVAEAMGKVGK